MMAIVRPRVVMITTDHRIDRRILLEADSLEAAGFEVSVVALPSNQSTDCIQDDRRVIRLWTEGLNSEKSQALPAQIFTLSYRWMINHVPNVPLVKVLKEWAWRYFVNKETFFSRLFEPTLMAMEADIFVAHDLPTLPVAVKVAEAKGAKVVFDSHELYCEQGFSSSEKKRWQALESQYIGRCHAVVTVNQSIAEELKNRYGLATVEVVMNAEHPVLDGPTRKLWHELYELPHDAVIALYQGGLLNGRNLEVLVDALAYCRNERLHLVYLGDGPAKAQLLELAEKNPARKRIHFHNYVEQSLLLNYTRCADFGFIPYTATCLNNYYCTPNKLFEYVAAGVPMIASDLPEISRLVFTHQLGIVNSFNDAKSLAKEIEAFAFGEELNRITEKTRLATQLICWSLEGEKFVNVVRSALNSETERPA